MRGGKCLTWGGGKKELSPVDTDAKSVSYTVATPQCQPPDQIENVKNMSVVQTARSVTLGDLLSVAANLAVATHSCRVMIHNIRTIRQQPATQAQVCPGSCCVSGLD